MPSHLCVSLPCEDDFLNATVYLDIMKIVSQSILNGMKNLTKLSAARFSTGASVEDIQTALETMWTQTHLEVPEDAAADSGPVLTSSRWGVLHHAHGNRLQTCGVEGHNGPGEGEWYHSFVRHVFSTFKNDACSLSNQYALKLVTKAVSDPPVPVDSYLSCSLVSCSSSTTEWTQEHGSSQDWLDGNGEGRWRRTNPEGAPLERLCRGRHRPLHRWNGYLFPRQAGGVLHGAYLFFTVSRDQWHALKMGTGKKFPSFIIKGEIWSVCCIQTTCPETF